MTRQYATEALVLGYRKLGEADRIVDLFTQSRGRVPTVVKGVRKVTSRWGGRLEPFTHLQVQLHTGRNLHTLTGADTLSTHAGLRTDVACLQAGLSLAEMVTRSTPELHRKPRTYNLFLRYLELMDRLSRVVSGDGNGFASDLPPDAAQVSVVATDMTVIMDDPPTAAAELGGATGGIPAQVAMLTLAAQLKILLLAGFLPHLGNCSLCGGETGLAGFSAEAGGVICTSCARTSSARKYFAVAPETLGAMAALLESPLAGATGTKVTLAGRREIRRGVREICEFHLGIRLKVEPWQAA